MTRDSRRSRASAFVLVAAGVLLTLVGANLTTARAIAAFHEITEVGKPGLLTLAVHEDTPLWTTLGPGDSAKWLVRASLSDAEQGSLAIELDTFGAMIDVADITASVDACSRQFDASSIHLANNLIACNGNRVSVLQPTSLSELSDRSNRFELARLNREHPRELLVTLTVPNTVDPNDIAGADIHIGVGVHVSGEDPIQETHPRLSATGSDMFALAVLAAGLTGIGAGLIAFRQLRGSPAGSIGR